MKEKCFDKMLAIFYCTLYLTLAAVKVSLKRFLRFHKVLYFWFCVSRAALLFPYKTRNHCYLSGDLRIMLFLPTKIFCSSTALQCHFAFKEIFFKFD